MLNYLEESNSVVNEKTQQNGYACHIWLCAIYFHTDKIKIISCQIQRAKVEHFSRWHTPALTNKVEGECSPPLWCTVQYSKAKVTLLSLQWREYRYFLPFQMCFLPTEGP